ncbi:hypothetical protein JTE90_013275 [Oedothorax gibbosus]|uniref:PID domain-containing protein n=1 Tax=Oedothorax gibbosus TaxID=931172 RepID=A0AAV6VDB3_9ARAC|nr:hypothetical protein JTE90_013275 [Oedothorax gibbosus]
MEEEFTIWNSISCPNLEILDQFVKEKVASTLEPFILPDNVIFHMKDILQNEISSSLSNSEESSLPITITYLTERFKEQEGEYVSICIHFSILTVTLVRFKVSALPEIKRKHYELNVNLFNQPNLKIYETFAGFVKEFFNEFRLIGRTIPIGFCTHLPMKQLSISTAILPLGIENLQTNQIDMKTVFEQVLRDAVLQDDCPLPVHSPTVIPQVNENGMFNAKYLGAENVLGLETDLEIYHNILTKMHETSKTSQDVALEISHFGIKIQVKGLEDVLHHHPLNKISRVTQDYKDSYSFGYVFGDYVKGHQLFGFKTECKSAEIMLVLKNTFEKELMKKKKEELNMKASRVFLELKDFLNLAHHLKAMEQNMPETLKERVELVEDISWWMEGCKDDVSVTLVEPKEYRLSVKIQELYYVAVEMKLIKIETKEETQRKIDKANKRHRIRKKEDEDTKPDDFKIKKSALHPNQVKVSQILDDLKKYFKNLLDNRQNKFDSFIKDV